MSRLIVRSLVTAATLAMVLPMSTSESASASKNRKSNTVPTKDVFISPVLPSGASGAAPKQGQTKTSPLIGGAIGGWATDGNDDAAVGKAKPGAASVRLVPVAQLKRQQKSSLPAAPGGSLSAPADRRLPVIEGGGSLKQPCGMGHLGCLDGDPPSGKGFNPKK